MPQLVLTIVHQLSQEWKARNVLNNDELHFERHAKTQPKRFEPLSMAFFLSEDY